MIQASQVIRIAACALALAIAGCGKKDAGAGPGGAGGPGANMPPPQVSVITASERRLTLETTLPGRLEATRVAQVRARAAGIVQKRNFQEGGEVRAGQVLFQIDPAPFRATYESAAAALARAEANLAHASMRVKRYRPLIEANAISRQEYDDTVSAQKQAQADMAQARAARQNASISLGYANVTAPISGRIGRALVTEGALVGQGEATPLATIQQVDPIYVTMTQSSAEVMRLQRMMASGQLAGVGRGQARVSLVLEDGSTYPQTGRLLFAEKTVDEATGAVLLRAEFPNPQGLLMPGTYVRASLEQGVNEAALTVPVQAVQRTSEGATVMVVGPDNKVAARPVTTGAQQDGEIVIASGLKSGERVIVEGFQKAKPGAPVQAQPWKGPVGASATPAAAGVAAPNAAQ